MKNPIIFTVSILASTIVPNVVISDAALAQNGVDLTSCVAMPQEEKAESIAPFTTPLGTAKDLMLGGPQKVNTQCFFSFGHGPNDGDIDNQKVPFPAPIVIEMPKPDQLELIRISF